MTWIAMPTPCPWVDDFGYIRTISQEVAKAGGFETERGPFTLRIQVEPDVAGGYPYLADLAVTIGLTLERAKVVTNAGNCQEVSACWQPGVKGVRVQVLPTQERA